jgi:hypothetical protein
MQNKKKNKKLEKKKNKFGEIRTADTPWDDKAVYDENNNVETAAKRY